MPASPTKRWRRRLGPLFLALSSLAAGRDASPDAGTAILQDVRAFRETGGVLLIAAHPDDENSRLLAYFAQGRACRTAYLSLTRGDGGQNLIGPELGDELGVIRTRELLAARGVDGASQYFSRARDFGFSIDYRQALRVWNEQEVLVDVVRVIRTFRPDVIITRFPPRPSHTHGQHTASAVLALEAFKLAGDPKAFPEQLRDLAPWQPKRIFWNSTPFRSRGAAPGPLPSGTIRLDAGGYQPELGEWFGVLAARSRSEQRTQGMGAVGTRGSWFETFTLLAGEPAASDLFDGIDTTWGRFPGGADIGRRADEVFDHFNVGNPSASVPALLALRKSLAVLAADPVVAEKKALLDRILRACLGLHVETVLAEAEKVPGETLALRHSVIEGSSFPVRWLGVRYPSEDRTWGEPVDLASGRESSREGSAVLPAATPLSQAFWLREQGGKGLFGLADSALAIRPENLPVFPVEEIFAVGGQTLAVPDEPVQVTGDPARGEIRRKLEAIPPVAVDFFQPVELFAPGASRTVKVEVTAARPAAAGLLRLEAPAGWGVAPAGRPFRLAMAGERAVFSFTVTAPPHPDSADLIPSAEVGGIRCRTRRVDIRYEHLPQILYQPVARLKAVSLHLAIRGRRIGYLAGAGDLVPEALREMGYDVSPLRPADLTPERLAGFDAVVLGVRAFNVHSDLSPRLPALWKYAESGGNVIVQYNTNYGLKSGPLAPWPLEIADGRVTDEDAPVRLLAPDHPALAGPNRIGPEDFAGWVQERARYLPTTRDPRFVPLLASNDPGQPSNDASLLVARTGKGYYVYSGLAWFRELPAGVPGAYRLFANLVSLGK